MFSFLQKINSKKTSSSCNQLQQPNDNLKSSLPQNIKLNTKDSHLLTTSSTLDGVVDYSKFKNDEKLFMNGKDGKDGGAGGSLSKFSLRKSFNLHQNNQSKNNFDRKSSHLSLASLGSGYFTTGRRFDKKKPSSTSLGLCYLMYGPETKRTLLPSQVTGIDTVKALFVRAFPDKLTMNYLDDEQSNKIYIKDQLKDLFYQLDEMNDIKDRCVLKLVELNGALNTKNSSQLSLVSNSTLINSNGTLTKQHQHQSQAIYSNGQVNGESLDKSHQRALFNEYYSNSNAPPHLQNCQDQISKLQKHQQNLAQLPPMVPNHQYRNTIMNDTEQQSKYQHQQNGFKKQFDPQLQVLETQMINSRSLSEPRANQTNLVNRTSTNNQHYGQLTSNFAYESSVDGGSVQPSSGVESYHHINGSAETYDNLSDHQLTHQSRIDTNKYLAAQTTTAQSQQHDRYNGAIRPHYNSMRLTNHHGTGASERDIKSVDREILYNYYKLNTSKQQSGNALPPPPIHPHQSVNNFVRNIPKRQSLQCYNLRDIKSCERDTGVLTSSSSSSSQNTPINNKNSTIIKMMPPLPPPPPPSITIAPAAESDVTIRSRSGSITPRHQQQQFETDATEDDDLTCTSSSIYQYDLNNNSNHLKKDEVKKQHEQFNNALTENDFLDNLDENDIENFETSKIKMKLMQKQLYDLTNLVNQALINKDLNQLAAVAQYNMQNSYHKIDNSKSNYNNQHIHHPSNGQQQLQQNHIANMHLKALNEKTKSLKNDLGSLKKLQENLNSSFGNSMKNFVQQLNEKLKSFCLNEINEKIKLDLVLYKYQIDSSKVENELCDLESVVDDLRENILKHKCNVSIDDIECYALALSQLSKQLIGLKGSFSNIKEQLKANASGLKQQSPEKLSENKFLITESSKLDLIIRRCKRITGILIVLKKLSIMPRLDRSSKLPTKIPSSTSCESLNDRTRASSVSSTISFGVNGNQSQFDSINEVKPQISKDLLYDIESINPDHDQRRLAIEVDNAFNQLMSEISLITSEINLSKSQRTNSTSSLLSTTLENTLDNYDSLKIVETIPKTSLKTREKSVLATEDKSEAAKNYTNSIYEKILDKYLNKSFMSDNPDLKIDTQFEDLLCESEETMKKRYKFRLQKNSLKEEKENSTSLNQNSTSKSPQNSSSPVPSQANVSSPVSSMSSASSSSSSASSPSSPSITPSQSTPSPSGETNTTPNHASHTESSSPKTNEYSNLMNTSHIVSSSPPTPNQTTSNYNVITHLIKPIDRTFLETVQEEEVPSSNTDESNKKPLIINSVSVQSFESASSSKEEKSTDETNQSKSQLYEQLSQLKPLKSQSFKSTTSICLNPNVNGESTSLGSSTETSSQNKVVTSSMVITPNITNPIEVSNEKDSSCVQSKIPIASAADSNPSFRNSQSVRFNDYSKSFPLRNGVLSKFSDRKDLSEKPLLTSSMELSCKQVDSNDLTQNGSLNDLPVANNSINKTSMLSSMIIPRRNSALIPAITTNLTNNSRRVSVSDL